MSGSHATILLEGVARYRPQDSVSLISVSEKRHRIEDRP
jgi:hypothetical protein